MTVEDNYSQQLSAGIPVVSALQVNNFGEQIRSALAVGSSREPTATHSSSGNENVTREEDENTATSHSSSPRRWRKKASHSREVHQRQDTRTDRDEELLAVAMSSSEDNNLVFEDEHPRSSVHIPTFMRQRRVTMDDDNEKIYADALPTKNPSPSRTTARPHLERGESSSSALDGIVEAAAFPFFQASTSHSVKSDPEKLPTTFEQDGSNHDLEGSDAGFSGAASSVSSNSTSSSIYILKDMSTGKKYDIRELERRGSAEQCFNVGYSLFPTKDEIMEEMSERQLDADGDKKEGFSPTKATRDAVMNSSKAITSRLKRTFSSKPDGEEDRQRGDGHITEAPDSRENEASSNHDDRQEEDDTSAIQNPPNIILKSFFGRNQSESTAEKRDEDDSESSSSKTKDASPILARPRTRTMTEDSSTSRQRRKPRKEKRVKAAPILQPKNTMPVKCTNKPKSSSDFNPLLLTSTITKAHDGPIWCTATTKDGKYLATGGADAVIKIWEMGPTKDQSNNLVSTLESLWKGMVGEDQSEPNAPPLNTVDSECDPLGTEIAFLNPKPLQRFTDHDKDVVDLSWSNTNFLVSASLDKTARLWHPTRPVCLRIFRHVDAVTSVSFNPDEDKYFLSGGFDKKLRIWNIPNGRVAEWAQATNLITAATYDPEGKFIAAGLYDGKVIFYSLDGVKMKYFTQITCKNSGKKKGKKVTGLTFLPELSDDKVTGDKSPKRGIKAAKAAASNYVRNLTTMKKKQVKKQLLVTTNDSRLRLVGMNDYCMVRKFKGNLNTRFQIKARFSESGEFIISGSENRTCTVWNTATKRNPLNLNVTGLHMYDKVKAYESFEATKADPPVVTDALFVSGTTVKNAFLSSGLFPTLHSLHHVQHDFSSAVIITFDYEGTMRVFLRRACFDAVCHVAGPMGN